METITDTIEIVGYEPKYAKAFRQLNEEWITTFFKMEAIDYRVLDNPEDYILSNGGFIFVALLDGKAVGVCALILKDEKAKVYELSKLAVSPKAQGKHLGYLLCAKVLDKAKELGAHKVFLETNTQLKPAIRLYEKLGFKSIPLTGLLYERVDYKMEINLQA